MDPKNTPPQRALGADKEDLRAINIRADAHVSAKWKQRPSKIAHDVNEACELIEAGFDYVTGKYSDRGRIFRKQK